MMGGGGGGGGGGEVAAITFLAVQRLALETLNLTIRVQDFNLPKGL